MAAAEKSICDNNHNYNAVSLSLNFDILNNKIMGGYRSFNEHSISYM